MIASVQNGASAEEEVETTIANVTNIANLNAGVTVNRGWLPEVKDEIAGFVSIPKVVTIMEFRILKDTADF